MFGRFLKKRVREDQRAHYRRLPDGGDALAVKVISSKGTPVPGTLMDLSAGGAAVQFDQDMSGDLEVGEVRELVFSSLTTPPFRAAAVVRSVPAEGQRGRHGFEFVDGADLFENLDDSFYRYFNRRRFRRAKPALGERFHAELSFDNYSVDVDVRDVSMSGVGIGLQDDVAQHLGLDMSVALDLFVPKTDLVLRTHAIVRHITPDSRHVRVGLAMEPIDEGADKRTNKRARAALADYIQRRLDDIDRYNSAFK